MRTMFLLLYSDPGSGMMLLQLLLATIAGAGFYFRNFLARFVRFGRGAGKDVETK
jgi:hypothetical protein